MHAAAAPAAAAPAAAAAAAAQLVSISPKLKPLPLVLSRSVHSGAGRRFYVPYQLQRRSPPLAVPRPSPPTIPELQFPDTVAWCFRPSPSRRRSGIPRFALLPAAASQQATHHPAITVLPPPSGMLCYVQVVGTPTADTPGACLMLHFDNRRYLFGRVAEGTQRNLMQRKVSLSKLLDIFLTGRVDCDSTGGLLGMILTLAELKAASAADLELVNKELRSRGKKDKDLRSVIAHLNVHGGKNLLHVLAAARRYILRKALPVHTRELRRDPRAGATDKAEPDYEDENIRVWSIPVSADNNNDPYPSSDPPHPGQRSPKKRKLSPPASAQEGLDGPALAAEEADQALRESVVKDMFGSKWSLDTLREMPLRDVRLPAALFVRNDQGHIEPYAGPPAEECPDAKVLVRLPWPAARVEQLPRTEPSRQSMCYVVRCHSRRGKFDAAAAVRLGVVRTDFRKLTLGESVPGKDGTTVTPSMVMGPPVEGRGFAVIDIPFPDVIDNLLRRPEWSDPAIMTGVDVMYWILSDGVTLLEDARVQQFMRSRPSVRHIVLGSAVCPNVPALESPMAQLIKMNRVDPRRFPLPKFDANPPRGIPKELEPVVEIARAGLRYQLAPKPGFSTDAVVPAMNTGKPVWELATQSPQVLELARAAHEAVSDPAFLAEVEDSQRDLPCPDAEIIPLGTGSAMPSKYRNVSAVLLRVPGWGSYLLDCGENTLGQLRRSFGYDGADDVLRDLRAILISHAHADHHLGTISVVARWRELDGVPADRKLAVVATPKFQDFVRESHDIQPLSPSRILNVTLRSTTRRPLPGAIARPVLHPSLGLPAIEACYVDHCFEATALVLTFPDTGLKVAYSGDCRPSAAFADLARGAHLLIHECTFDDDLAGDARAKKHSTLSEALSVGRLMGARRILLTHFSQRYPKLPVVDEAALLRGSGGLVGDQLGEEEGQGVDGVAGVDGAGGEDVILNEGEGIGEEDVVMNEGEIIKDVETVKEAETRKEDEIMKEDGTLKEVETVEEAKITQEDETVKEDGGTENEGETVVGGEVVDGTGRPDSTGTRDGAESEAKRDVEVLFAFDLMRVRLGEFKQAKMFLPALRELLKEDECAERAEQAQRVERAERAELEGAAHQEEKGAARQGQESAARQGEKVAAQQSVARQGEESAVHPEKEGAVRQEAEAAARQEEKGAAQQG